jgi:cytochrome c peroxidase
LTETAFRLGERLFFDPLLSADRTVACASCHRPQHGFSSPEPLPRGVHDRRAKRHAPALLNRAWGRHMMWDGRVDDLEQQVLMPITDPDEMGLSLAEALQRLNGSAEYRRRFADLEAGTISESSLAEALASFVRGLVLADSPADRFLLGTRDALTREERAGQWIWESKGKCWQCHPRPLFTDETFHNTGVGIRDGRPEPGRGAVTGKSEDLGKFKTPTLRGLVQTAPYMHDGSLATLDDVIAFYRRGGNPNPNLSPLLHPLELTDQEAAHLLAFLRALSRSGD